MANPTQGQGQSNVQQGQGQTGIQQRGQAGVQQGRQQQGGMMRRDPFAALRGWESFAHSPFSLMRRMAEDMDRFFEDVRAGGGIQGGQQQALFGQGGFVPTVEVFERDDNLVVRADLPGLKKDEVRVEFTDQGLVLEGERKSEHEERKKGVFHSERSYGSFRRVIPLPENVQAEDAKATFQNGVLEICFKLPQETARNRRIEIQEGGGTAPGSTQRH